MKLTPEYVNGFLEVCYDAGLPEKQACMLLEVAALHIDMKDPDFKKGFEECVTKSASFQPPDLTGAFSATHPRLANGVEGFGLGSLAGGALGLASILRPSIGRGPAGGLLMKLNKKPIPFLNPAAVSRASKVVPDWRAAKRMAGGAMANGAAIPVPLKAKMQSRITHGLDRFFGPGNKRIFGGALAGGAAGAGINSYGGYLSGFGSNMPSMDHNIPIRPYGNVSGGQASGTAGTNSIQMPGGPLAAPGSFDVINGFTQNSGGQQPSSVDQRIADIEAKMDRSGTIQAALHNNRLRSQLADLEREKVRASSENAIFGGFNRQQNAGAGYEIANKLKQVEEAIQTRERRAGDAAAWMERSGQGGPTTLSNFLPQMMNRALGNEAGAQQIGAELQELYRMRHALNNQLAQFGQN